MALRELPKKGLFHLAASAKNCLALYQKKKKNPIICFKSACSVYYAWHFQAAKFVIELVIRRQCSTSFSLSSFLVSRDASALSLNASWKSETEQWGRDMHQTIDLVKEKYLAGMCSNKDGNSWQRGEREWEGSGKRPFTCGVEGQKGVRYLG